MNLRFTILSLALALSLISCSDPYNQRLPESDIGDDVKFSEAISKIPSEDRNRVVAYLLRRELGGAFGQKVDKASTVREAVDLQIAFERAEEEREAAEALERKRAAAEQEALRQAEAEKIRKLRDEVNVAVITTEFVERNIRANRFDDSVTIVIAFQNRGEREIIGIKGSLQFDDIFGDRIKTVNLSYDQGLPPQETKRWTGSISYNQFDRSDKKFANTPLDKMVVTWNPDQIVYADTAPVAAE